jgi:hypothetical protein
LVCSELSVASAAAVVVVGAVVSLTSVRIISA